MSETAQAHYESSVMRTSSAQYAKKRDTAIASERRFTAIKVAAQGLLLCVVSLLLSLGVSAQTKAAQSGRAQPQPAFPFLPSGPGRETVIKVCSNCHSPDRLVTHGQSREEWEATLTKMTAYGMTATNDELNEILDYVSKNFPKPPDPKINVNKATAVEMELGLGLSAKEAKLIVEYRAKNGDFKTIDDLKKVPDIDSKKLVKNKSRLSF